MWSSTSNQPVSKIRILATLASVLLERVHHEEQQEEQRQRLLYQGHYGHTTMDASHTAMTNATSTLQYYESTNAVSDLTEDSDVGDPEQYATMDTEDLESLKSAEDQDTDDNDDSQDNDDDTNGSSESDSGAEDDLEFNEADDESYDGRTTASKVKRVVVDLSTRPYWMDPEWIPMTTPSPGNPPTQKTPQEIRDAMQRYMKSARGQKKTKTKMLMDLGVNSNSFRKFMDPKSYKDQWRAIENGSYWAAARFLEAEHAAPNRSNTSVAMDYIKRVYFPPTATKAPHVMFKDLTNTTQHARTANVGHTQHSSKLTKIIANGRALPPTKRLSNVVRPWKRANKTARDAAVRLMRRIGRVDAKDLNENQVFDTRLQIVQKIQDFMQQAGVSKANFCREALEGINRKSLDKFLASSQSPRSVCTNAAVYGRAYIFFEKKRLMEHAPKTADRRRNERNGGIFVRPIRAPPSPSLPATRRRHRSAAAVDASF